MATNKPAGTVKDVRMIEPEKIYEMAAGWEAENVFLKKIAAIAYEPQSQFDEKMFQEWYHKLLMAFREYQIWITDTRGNGVDLMTYLNGETAKSEEELCLDFGL